MSSTRRIKKVLLITEDRKSDFSRKVIRAARVAKKNLLIEEATFSALTRIIEGKIGVVVVDRDNVGGVADHFFRAIRMFRSHTPVLMPFSKKLLLEQMFTQAYKKNVTTSQLARIMVKPALSSSEEEKRQIKLHQINEEYKKTVKPIFQKSCFACHSGQTQYPWYYKLPIAKQLIDSDIREAKKHIDLTNDFPFRGHGSPEEDLAAIRKAIEDHTMPPFRYKILHPGSQLSEGEQQIVLRWIKESLKALVPYEHASMNILISIPQTFLVRLHENSRTK